MKKRLTDVLMHATSGKFIPDIAIYDDRAHVVVVKEGTKTIVALCGVVGAPDEQESRANAALIAHLLNTVTPVVTTIVSMNNYLGTKRALPTYFELRLKDKVSGLLSMFTSVEVAE